MQDDIYYESDKLRHRLKKGGCKSNNVLTILVKISVDLSLNKIDLKSKNHRNIKVKQRTERTKY